MFTAADAAADFNETAAQDAPQQPHIRLAATYTNLGLVLRALGREEEARTCLITGLKLIEERFGEHLHCGRAA